MLTVFYVAVGYPYLVMAANSARTLRETGTKCQVHVLTDLPLKSVSLGGRSLFDKVICLSNTEEGAGKDKFAVYQYADELNIFLDADTEVLSRLDAAEDLMRSFDVAIRCMDRPARKLYEVKPGLSTADAAVANLNTGVIIFRRSRGAALLFERWERCRREMDFKQDQPSFVRAFLESPETRLLPLAANWNARPLLKGDLELIKNSQANIKVLHYRNPAKWPEAGRRLAQVYFEADWVFFDMDDGLRDTISSYAPRFSRLGSPMFRTSIGRRFMRFRDVGARLKPWK